jgi:hypothetical protein
MAPRLAVATSVLSFASIVIGNVTGEWRPALVYGVLAVTAVSVMTLRAARNPWAGPPDDVRPDLAIKELQLSLAACQVTATAATARTRSAGTPKSSPRTIHALGAAPDGQRRAAQAPQTTSARAVSDPSSPLSDVASPTDRVWHSDDLPGATTAIVRTMATSETRAAAP